MAFDAQVAWLTIMDLVGISLIGTILVYLIRILFQASTNDNNTALPLAANDTMSPDAGEHLIGFPMTTSPLRIATAILFAIDTNVAS